MSNLNGGESPKTSIALWYHVGLQMGEKIVALYLDLDLDSYPQLLIEHAGYEAD